MRQPVQEFTGKIIAIIHRINDVEDKWVVAPENMSFTKEEIMAQVAFQEQYFQTEMICFDKGDIHLCRNNTPSELLKIQKKFCENI